MARYLGFDGFRGGWVAAWIDDDGQQGFNYSPTIDRLLKNPHTRAMIDIPIGLPDKGNRACDVAARTLLGPSVFVGVRRSLLGFAAYGEANCEYRKCDEPGISQQLWHIRDKIGEIDRWVRAHPSHPVHETHPELVFWRLNGGEKLPHKKTDEGRQTRIALLQQQKFTRIEQFLAWRFGTGIGRDDLIDACACAVAARDANDVLGDGLADACGLKMEMHY